MLGYLDKQSLALPIFRCKLVFPFALLFEQKLFDRVLLVVPSIGGVLVAWVWDSRVSSVDYASFCDISFSKLLLMHMNEL